MLVQITGIKRQVMISCCLYMGQILVGYSGAWSGPVIPKLRNLEQSPFPYLLTETQLSLVATLVYLGSVIGPYVIAWLSNTMGRKPCLLFGGSLSALGYVFLITTRNLPMLLISRLLIGISGGIISVSSVLYIGEIASSSIRGILLTVIGISTTFGFLMIYSIGPYVSYNATIYIALALCVIFIIGSSWIPETPIFYAIQGKNEELIKELQDLGRTEDVEEMLKIKKESIDPNTKKDWKELFTIRSNRKALLIVIIINSLQHCSGLVAVIFFSATIFDMAGSSIDSNISMIIVTCFQLAGSLVAPFLVESVGRKIILTISSAVCSLSMFILGLYFYLDSVQNPVVEHVKWLPLVALAVFFIIYDSGFGTIPTVLTGEMFTSNVRSKGSTLTITFAYFCGFAVTTAFGALLKTVGGHMAFWFFSLACACAFIFAVIFVPETKGKSLLEIQEAL